jgi:16S rRNA (guanine527-N7)-methyltransferase
MKNIKLIEDSLKKLNIDYNELQVGKLSAYYDILMEWNCKMNLTSIISEEDVITKHFIDSLLVAKVIDLRKINSLIDIGTGAGFPAIPIKILFPHIQMTLIDALNKRINFLNHLCKEIELEGVECIHGRAEQYGQNPSYREQFDLSVSRAVSQLSVLSEYCIPFVNIDGYFISYKSIESTDEINLSKNAIHILGGHLEGVKEVTLPFTEITRSFAVIKKVKGTDDKYPRKEGKPSKKPL